MFVQAKIQQMLTLGKIRSRRYTDDGARPTTVDESILEWYFKSVMTEDSIKLRAEMIEHGPWSVGDITRQVRQTLKLSLMHEFGTICPIDGEDATDMHEVVLPRNDLPPVMMLANGAFCRQNCILVSRATNMQGEEPEMRRQLISVMSERGIDTVGWLEGLDLLDGLPGGAAR